MGRRVYEKKMSIVAAKLAEHGFFPGLPTPVISRVKCAKVVSGFYVKMRKCTLKFLKVNILLPVMLNGFVKVCCCSLLCILLMCFMP